jgi:hypothetical protein
MYGFLDAILDDGLVHQREHFFGLRFGGGQEARTESRGGEYGFTNFGGHTLQFAFSGAGLATASAGF